MVKNSFRERDSLSNEFKWDKQVVNDDYGNN